MDRYKNALDRYASETSPSEAELVRYNVLVDRVVRGERPQESGVPWLTFGLGFGALAAAAAALLIVGTGPSRDDPLSPMTVDQPQELVASLTEDVEMTAAGKGKVSGTRGAPVYELEEGRVLFSVTPEQGIHLKVRTEEAEVEVLGTVFEVKRTALGTEVSVERGKVLVSCKDPGREPQSIIEGQTVTCLPVTGTAWFNRANALGEGGDREHYAAAIDAALAAGVEPYQRAELLGKRMALNVERRQELSALADAKAYLETGETVRRRSALNVAALYSYSLEGSCEAAAPYIELMTTEGVALDPQLLAACPQ